MYGGGVKDHPLRTLLVERFAFELVANWREKANNLPKEFALEALDIL